MRNQHVKQVSILNAGTVGADTSRLDIAEAEFPANLTGALDALVETIAGCQWSELRSLRSDCDTLRKIETTRAVLKVLSESLI
jgi:hypothetical protein